MHKDRMDHWNQDDPRFDLTEDDDFPKGVMFGVLFVAPLWGLLVAAAWGVWVWLR
jgi:hypothetical protein